MRQAEEKKPNVAEEADPNNLAAERSRYQSFWVGVNRGIILESKNPRLTDDEDKKKDFNALKRSKGIFESDGRWRLIWSAYITLLIIYSVVIIPLRLGFEPRVTYPFEVLENLILVSFTVDILVNFNTTFQEAGSENVVHSRRTIALNYLKFWFWVDLLSTIPFTEVGSWFASTDVSVLRAIRILRLLRIFKLFRINKFNETLQNLRINQHIISLLVLLLGIFFVAHLFACGWHYMALQKEQTTGGETWVNALGFAEQSIYDLYVASLYYVMVTMMTVGFGDIHPVTDNERMYAIATMLTGGVVFGAMISRLALILEKRNPQAKALRQNLVELKSYLVDIGLSIDMRRQTVDAYKYYLHKKSVFGEPDFFEDLPQPILFRLMKQLNEDDIRSVKLFHTYEMEFVVILLLTLKPFQAAAGETIFSEGDICNTIVFLKKGKVSLSTSNGFKNTLVGYVRAGGHFGDMEYLRNTPCLATYAASKHAQLLSVTHTTLSEAATKCLDAGVRFRYETELRYSLFNQVIKQNKRDQDQGYAQYTLEESRAIVGKLMHQNNGVGQRQNLTPRLTPRRWMSFQSAHALPDKDIAAPEAQPKQLKKSLTTSTVNMMWIDGVIVDTRNLTLLAHNSDQFTGNGADEIMVRVIYRNKAGKIGPGEVPESYFNEHLIISPMNPYKIAWDMIIAVMVVYSVVIIPMEIAFDSIAFAGSPSIETVTDAFYLLDVVISFRTAYFEDEGDYLVVVPYLVAKQYLFTWCIVDLVGSLPFDEMAPSSNSGFTKLLKVIRLTRLLKLARLFKVGNVSEEVEERLGLSPAVMSLFTLLLQVFFVGHLMACILFGMSTVITDHPWYEEDTTAYPSQADADLGSKYILSLYWTFTIMSTVGYGDVLPNNTAQRLLCVFVILLGASMFGYMIANVSALVQSFSTTDSVKDDRIADITVYLDEKQTPLKLQDTVIKHFRNYFKQASPFDVDAMLGRLPQKLANEILLIHNETTMKSISILRYIENVSVRLYIFNLMKPVYYEPNEFMLQEGVPGQEIMFIVEGGAQAMKKVKSAVQKVERPKLRQKTKSFSSRAARNSSPTERQQNMTGSSENHESSTPVQSQCGVSSDEPEVVKRMVSRSFSSSGNVWPSGKSRTVLKLGAAYYKVPMSESDENAYKNLGKWSKRSSADSMPASIPEVKHVPDQPAVAQVADSESVSSISSTAAGWLRLVPPEGSPLEREEKKSDSEEISVEMGGIYPYGSLDDLSFVPASPHGVTRPSSKLKFAVHRVNLRSKFDTSDSSGNESEYESLRKAQSPHALQARKSRKASSKHSMSQESLKSSLSAPPAPAPRQLLFTFSELETKFENEATTAEVFEDSSDDSEESLEQDDHTGVDTAPHLSEASMKQKGLEPIGALSPGSFVGHLAVMHNVPHEVSVVTTTFSTVYVLHKQDIISILTSQPTVGIQLQMAMSRAISTQSDTLGKLHMRQNRSRFLVETKERFYTQLAVKPAEVKRIRKAHKGKMVRIARGFYKKKPKSLEKEERSIELARTRTVGEDRIRPVETTTGNDASLDATQERNLSNGVRSFLYRSFAPARRLASSRRRIPPKVVVRRVKHLEHVLTKHSVFYDSDAECDGPLHAHRPALPLKVTLRATDFPPPVVMLERPLAKRRRSSFSSLANSTAPEAPTPVPRLDLTRMEPRPSISNIPQVDRPSLFQRMFTARVLTARKEVKHRNRVMSLNDLDMFESVGNLCTPPDGNTNPSMSSAVHPPASAIVPTYSNHLALHRSADALVRRQSFPSLENDLWKINTASQGLL